MAEQNAETFVFVYDRREKDTPERKIKTNNIKSYASLRACIQEVCAYANRIRNYVMIFNIIRTCSLFLFCSKEYHLVKRNLATN